MTTVKSIVRTLLEGMSGQEFTAPQLVDRVHEIDPRLSPISLHVKINAILRDLAEDGNVVKVRSGMGPIPAVWRRAE